MEDVLLDLETALQREDWGLAEKLIHDLLKEDGMNPSLWYNLGLARRKSGNNTQAIETLTKTLEMSPNHKGAMFERAAAIWIWNNFMTR